MMDKGTSVLVVDDEPGIHRAIRQLLKSDFSVYDAISGEEGLDKADDISPDLILLDLQMPSMSGMEVLKKLKESDQDIPVVIFTGYGSIDSAVRAIKLGAVDYIEKPFDNRNLTRTIKEILKGRKSFRKLSKCQNIIGESPQIKKVWRLIEKYGSTDIPILLQGETGTGKELFANAIHEISKRSVESFVPVDCSTIPESLFESEIFGYERGAFTGANISKPGQLDWANGGTFFLDEISNLPLIYQAKLLRVVQERRYVPLGARSAKEIDVRFVSSSNINLREASENGVFREDLYYRISGICIELPPLRERKGDIELLVRHFMDEYSRKYSKPIMEISDDAMEFLFSYMWPGNVRELRHVIASAVAVADKTIFPKHLPPSIWEKKVVGRKKGNGNGKVNFELKFSCDVTNPLDLKELSRNVATEAEKLVIKEVSQRLLLNQAEIAKFLSIDPKTLRSKLPKRAKSKVGKRLGYN
jgi:DNA-binding NtrC family response regulator